MADPISPHGPLKVAITVDDLFQWQGLPFPEGYSAHSVSKDLLAAFARYDVPEVYAFSATAPVDDDPSLLGVLDAWCEAGHHVGSHTHFHPSINWVSAEAYIADIERSDAIIAPWFDRAPTKYFRHAFAMAGDTPEKTAAVDRHLMRTGCLDAPITHWFYDAQFLSPYWRTLVAADEDARRRLQDMAVETAVSQLRIQAAAAREIAGRDPVHISLVHGTAIAGDTYGRILEAYLEAGVEFVRLEEATADPFNATYPPTTTRFFRNHTQRWAEYLGVPLDGVPPAVLGEIRELLPIDGMSEHEILGTAIASFAQQMNAVPAPDDFDW